MRCIDRQSWGRGLTLLEEVGIVILIVVALAVMGAIHMLVLIHSLTTGW